MTTLDQPVNELDARTLTEHRWAHTGLDGDAPTPTDLSGLPPGPAWPAFLQTMALFRFRHRFHAYLHRTYGDAYTVRLAPHGRPMVLFTRPEQTKEVFAADPEFFHAGKGNAILGPIMGEHSMLLQDGADHKRARKLIMPAFGGAAIKDYRSLVRRLSAEEVGRWRDGEVFASLERMNDLTLEVILRVVFGVTDERRLAALRPAVQAVIQINPALILGWGYPKLRRFGPFKQAALDQYALDELMYAEIRERRRVPDLDQRTDVLSRLMREGADSEDPSDRLSDLELRDQLVTLLLAGHETTATSLAWALFEVGRSPGLLDRSRRAASADPEVAAAAGGDEWLEAVLKESMRLHTIIPLVNRTLLKPATVAGYDLPAGTTVGPSIIVTHARSEHFTDPEVFRPQRFVGQNPPVNTWIPFGGGVRRCIGAGFAMMEGVEVLREVFSSYDVTAVGTDEPQVRNITSVPRRGARIRVSR